MSTQPCSTFTGSFFAASPPCTGNSCCCSIGGACVYWECTGPAAYQHFPTGQHRVRIVADFPSPVKLGIYGSPSGTCLAQFTTAATHFDVTVNAPLTDTVWQACEQNLGVGWTVYYTVQYFNAPGESPCVPPGADCQYGTEPTPAASFVYYLTPGLIDVWLTSVDMAWLAPLFTAFWFTTLNAQTVCGTGPPALPVINLATLDASIDSIGQILRSVAWPNICRCKTGTPAPVPFPLPNAPMPTGWPALPAIACSNIDLCSTVASMAQQLGAVSRSLSSNLELTQLLQRYRLPFAVIDGTAHSNTTGSASFSISRLVGMKAEVTTIPSGAKILAGNPPYYWDLGWMAIGNADGFTEEKRVTRTEQTWFPDTMPQATLFEYHLNPGVVCRFTEIQAEP